MANMINSLSFFYPREEAELFVGRNEELSRILFSINEVYTNRTPKCIVILGRKSIGKTMLIKEAMKRALEADKTRFVYLNCKFIPSNLKFFVMYLLERVMWWLIGFKAGYPNLSMSLDELNKMINRMRETLLRDFVIEKLEDIIQRYEEGDLQLALRRLVEIIERFSIDIKPVTIILDDFHVVLENKSEQISIFLNKLKTLSAPILYIFSSIPTSKTSEFIRKAREIIGHDVEIIKLNALSREEVAKLAERITKHSLPGKLISMMYNYTGGIPGYIVPLLRRALQVLSEMKTSWGMRGEEVLEKAYMAEVFTVDGNIAEELNNFLAEISQKEHIIKDILFLIAVNEGLSGATIAKSLGITENKTNSLLNELLEMGIFQEKNGDYFFRDQTFRAFIYAKAIQYDLSIISLKNPKVIKDLKKVIERLEATRYSKPSFKEWVGRVINQLRGESFSSLSLGRANIVADINIPTRLIENWTEKMGEKQLTVDILLTDDEFIIVEVKETEKIKKDHIEDILRKCDDIEILERKKVRACWIISQMGIDESAMQRAMQETGRIIILTDLKTINNIANKYEIEQWE